MVFILDMYDQLINGHKTKVNCRGNEQALEQCEIQVVGGNIDKCDVRAMMMLKMVLVMATSSHF